MGSSTDGFEISGARAPVPVQAIDGEKLSVIVMEQLPAVNLQHILNGTADFPKEFDFDAFSKGASDYLEALHREKQIVHADLYPRNLMTHHETGTPFIIDFGRSKHTQKLSKEERSKLENLDWETLENTLEEIRVQWEKVKSLRKNTEVSI